MKWKDVDARPGDKRIKTKFLILPVTVVTYSHLRKHYETRWLSVETWEETFHGDSEWDACWVPTRWVD